VDVSDEHPPAAQDAPEPPETERESESEAGPSMADVAASPPARVKPVVVPRWVQLGVLPVALLGLWALARAAGVVLLVFLVAGVIALILNPVVKLLQRGRLPRGVAVFAVYMGFFLTLGGLGVVLINPVNDQVKSFQRDVPKLVKSANRSLADLQKWLDKRHIGVHVKRQGETALQTLQKNVVKSSGSIVSFTGDLLRRLVEAGFGLVLVLVISIYMLLYAENIGRVVRAIMPPGDGTPEDDFALRAQKAVAGYVRGQVIFSLTMGISAGVALWIFGAVGIFPDGKRYALFFGAFYGLMEFVPYLGPVLGAIPPVLVAAFTDPLTAVWVVVLFVALQQLEGHVVAPQVFGHSLRINPLLVIFALLVGAELYGILGAFIALPIAAVVRETVVYLRRHLVLEPWGPEVQLLHEPPAPTVARTCRECGAEQVPGAVYCCVCGAALAPPVETPG
jgi:predicted PurR-regulated permease PerM